MSPLTLKQLLKLSAADRGDYLLALPEAKRSAYLRAMPPAEVAKFLGELAAKSLQENMDLDRAEERKRDK